jgi:hypothetical protein
MLQTIVKGTVRKLGVLGIGVMSIALLASGCDTTTTEQPATNKQAQVQTPAFDVPTLIGKNIDEIKAVLGTPQQDTEPNAQQIKSGVTEWEKQYTKDGKGLLVTYSVATKEVIDFFITTDKTDKEGLTTDKQHLLDIGNFKEGDANYKIEFVKALKNPSAYTGVKATPVK